MIKKTRGDVKLCKHEKAWETESISTIKLLHEILGDQPKISSMLAAHP
jgi:hypothetical protein